MHDRRHYLLRLAQPVALAALIIAGAALAWALTNLVRAQFADQPPTTIAAAPTASGAPTATGTATELASLPLFGRPQAAVTIPLTSQTKLELTLRGTVPGPEPDQGLAIIESDGRQQPYRVGDPIAGQDQVKLHEVHAEHVVLARLGRFETLRLSKPEGARGGGRTAASLPTRPAAAAASPSGRDLLTSIQALPHYENGQPSGFRLQVTAEQAPMLRRLGLRRTDVITAVNGVELNDPARAMQLLSQLRNERNIELKLRRQGAEKTLNIDTSQFRQ